jgi:hypothetical protein
MASSASPSRRCRPATVTLAMPTSSRTWGESSSTSTTSRRYGTANYCRGELDHCIPGERLVVASALMAVVGMQSPLAPRSTKLSAHR